MATLQAKAAKTLDMIVHTEGFTVRQHGTAIKVINDETGASVTYNGNPKIPSTHANDLTRLKRVGWTKRLYDEQRRQERDERMARADEDFERRYGELLKEAEQAVKTVAPVELPDGLTMRAEVITPEQALEYAALAGNPPPGRRQRPEAKRSIADYARTMREGKWRLTHQGIAFSTNPDGTEWLFDGQNRMQACMESGVPIPMVVWRNANPDTFGVVDSGKRRSIGDTLYSKGESNGPLLGSTLRLLHLWEHCPQEQWNSTPVDEDDLDAMLAKYPGVRESVTIANRVKRVKISPTSVAAADVLIRQAWPDAPIDEFWEQFVTGAIPEPKAPALKLRNYLLSQNSRRVTYNASQTGPKNVFHLYLVMHAWNNTCRGKLIGSIGWKLPIRVPEPYVPPKS
ncbi:hypothetical protein [Actinomadura violacea]|uniref:ParB/Sulfiredoxin domain-containing protein n=1 Tax=Actinomadura violacea TaxID=2819934 RepID=A0ABS3RY76_9ACTN|nr:hypothetical protein [Actinomadura violacea]MBO2461707.1 hypothetical protein [Actinomadura violacea]